LSLFKGDTKVSLLVYIWNLTHGGFPRDPNEFRIQVNWREVKIELREGWKTLLLGWSDDLSVFAGFECNQASNFHVRGGLHPCKLSVKH